MAKFYQAADDAIRAGEDGNSIVAPAGGVVFLGDDNFTFGGPTARAQAFLLVVEDTPHPRDKDGRFRKRFTGLLDVSKDGEYTVDVSGNGLVLIPRR